MNEETEKKRIVTKKEILTTAARLGIDKIAGVHQYFYPFTELSSVCSKGQMQDLSATKMVFADGTTSLTQVFLVENCSYDLALELFLMDVAGIKSSPFTEKMLTRGGRKMGGWGANTALYWLSPPIYTQDKGKCYLSGECAFGYDPLYGQLVEDAEL